MNQKREKPMVCAEHRHSSVHPRHRQTRGHLPLLITPWCQDTVNPPSISSASLDWESNVQLDPNHSWVREVASPGAHPSHRTCRDAPCQASAPRAGGWDGGGWDVEGGGSGLFMTAVIYFIFFFTV